MDNSNISNIRNKINTILEDLDDPLGRIFNIFIVLLIVLSSVIFVAETYHLPEQLENAFHYFDLIVLIVFSIEYILRIVCQPAPLKFIFSIFSVIDLLSILPLLLGIFDLRFIRIVRWFRLLRLIRFLESETYLFKIRNPDTIILTRIILTIVTIIFIYSGIIYQIEHIANPINFKTFLDAVYFCVVTMTTVGFGDLTPLSEPGRFVTIIMILTGILFIPWQLSEFLKQLLKIVNPVNKICSGCGLSRHDNDAKYCKMCGTEL